MPVFVNICRRISASAYQNFDEAILQLVPVRHRRLGPVPRRRLANMVTLHRRDRPVQHCLIPRSNQTHFTQHTSTDHIFKTHDIFITEYRARIIITGHNSRFSRTLEQGSDATARLGADNKQSKTSNRIQRRPKAESN